LDYKAKILQLEKEKMEWSQEKVELVTRAMVLSHVAGIGSTIRDIIQAMSQVSLKEGEIKGLKEKMEKLEQEMCTKDEKISQVQKEKVVLQEKINKLNSRLRGKILLQGDKHIIWDYISIEAAKFRSYLNFVNDKDNIAITTRHRCTILNDTLSKNPSEWAQNAINLLNSVPSTDLQTIGVKDRTALIIWARRIIAKHNLLKSVTNKATQMEQTVQDFKNLFEELFIKGLPSFWDGKGKFHDQEEYNALLTHSRMDHSKFETLEEGLKGATLVDKLSTNFEILNQFKTIKIGLPVMSYSTCIDLEILMKEMTYYEIPYELQ
jgi:hypothetical protein